MNRFAKSMLGVTLLEIMLVLAIAAMIVVLSIRYYQSATTSQQSNAALSQVQAVMAAMDNLGMSGGYASATTAQVSAIVGANNMVTPTGGTIVLGGNPTATTYSVIVPLSPGICTSVAAKLSNTVTNPKVTGATCNSGPDLTFSYNSTL